MVTLKTIADKAGCSVGTVDRILHDRGRFSAETAEKVRRIAAELDYRPNVLASHLSRSTICRIGVFLPRPEQDSSYWALSMEGLRRAEAEMGPFGLKLVPVHYDRYDSESYLFAGRRLKEGRFDGLLMAPLLPEETRVILQDFPEDLPVVFFDTALPGTERLGYIGQDSYQSGRLAARLMKLLTGGTSAVQIIAPMTHNEHLDNRISGFRDAFDSHIEIFQTSVESDHDDIAFSRTLEKRLTDDIKGIFVADASAHYAAQVLAQRGGERPALIGHDLIRENRPWVEQGVIDFLLAQRPADQVFQGIQGLFRKVFLKEDPPQRLHMPIDIITKENIADHREEETL